jgi:universal stress protein E
MHTYRHIVVGVDFSPASLSATKAAMRLASRHGTPVTVVHVVDPKQISMVQKSHQMSESDFLSNAFDHVHGFLEQLDAAGSGMTVEVEVGHPLLKLTAACAHHHSDLLVVGTRGTKHGPNQIGTIATKCVRKAPADVLLIREGAHAPFRRIVVCVDFSKNSANVVRSAMGIADGNDAELDCVFVFRGTVGRTVDYGGILPILPDATFEVPKGLKESLEHFLKPIFAGSRLTQTCQVLGGGSIRESIFEHARKNRADLVVLGTHGDAGLHTLLMGTAAESIVTHAPCSVLGVKPASVMSTELLGAIEHS